MKSLGSVQLINDRCMELQRSRHGSHLPLELKEQPLGPSVAAGSTGSEAWEGHGPAQYRHGFFLKSLSLGKGVFAFWVSVNSEIRVLNRVKYQSVMMRPE